MKKKMKKIIGNFYLFIFSSKVSHNVSKVALSLGLIFQHICNIDDNHSGVSVFNFGVIPLSLICIPTMKQLMNSIKFMISTSK